MNELGSGPQDSTETPVNARSRRSRGSRIFWVAFVVLIAVAAWLLFAPRGALEPESVVTQAPTREAAGPRPVMLYFADAESRRLVAEEREIPPTAALEDRIRATVAALVAGPDGRDYVRTLPRETRLVRLYFDPESATIYLDFDPTLVTRHPGGSAAESMTLGSILRTLGSNFPEITRVQILVDGAPIGSIAGHFDASKPIEIADWQ